MKINIVIFNWNYGRFLDVLLDKMLYIINNDSYRVIICDDGSTDGSLNIINGFIENNKALNMMVLTSEELNFGRDMPYLGQIENLKKVVNSRIVQRGDYIWLMDADDYFEFDERCDFFVNKIKEFDVAFTKVFNVYQGESSLLEIKRPVSFSPKIWPTISVTSSIIISFDFIVEYNDVLFSNIKEYNDVWLDSRINMLACNLPSSKVKYLQESVYRTIHSGGDSQNMPITRKISKQISSARYFKAALGNKFKYGIRTFILTALDLFV